MNYWSDKEKLTERARLNNISQEFNHKDEIAECIKNSKVYGGLEREPKRSDKKHRPQFVFLNTDSVSALKRSQIEKKAVLNFATLMVLLHKKSHYVTPLFYIVFLKNFLNIMHGIMIIKIEHYIIIEQFIHLKFCLKIQNVM